MAEKESYEALKYKLETLQQENAKQEEDKKKITTALQQLVNDLDRIQKLLDEMQRCITPCLMCKGSGMVDWFNEKNGNYEPQTCKVCSGWGYQVYVQRLVPELIAVLKLIGRK